MPATPYAVDDVPVELIHMIIEDIVNQHDVDGLASFVTSSPIIYRAFLSRREELLRNRLPKDRRTRASSTAPSASPAAPPQPRERTAGEDMSADLLTSSKCQIFKASFLSFCEESSEEQLVQAFFDYEQKCHLRKEYLLGQSQRTDVVHNHVWCWPQSSGRGYDHDNTARQYFRVFLRAQLALDGNACRVWGLFDTASKGELGRLCLDDRAEQMDLYAISSLSCGGLGFMIRMARASTQEDRTNIMMEAFGRCEFRPTLEAAEDEWRCSRNSHFFDMNVLVGRCDFQARVESIRDWKRQWRVLEMESKSSGGDTPGYVSSASNSAQQRGQIKQAGDAKKASKLRLFGQSIKRVCRAWFA
ncbi:hypothetical protein C8035_v004118 [Colletotrichum spinosum]|uniref:Uncharacterized protein n=1 Tax=Colletotrichum spinosum TaxID=1347390 RepID=A0A4R8QUA8_9PEZI|nr:hypothetical protein C8035_v004118 [Colletotrichum spinosum]